MNGQVGTLNQGKSPGQHDGVHRKTGEDSESKAAVVKKKDAAC